MAKIKSVDEGRARTRSSWLLVTVASLLLLLLIWSATSRAYEFGLLGAVTALTSPQSAQARRSSMDMAAIERSSSGDRAATLALDLTPDEISVKAEFPATVDDSPIVAALEQRRVDNSNLSTSYRIETDGNISIDDSQWIDHTADIIYALPSSTDQSGLHLLLSNDNSSIVGQFASEEEKQAFMRVLEDALPGRSIEWDSVKVLEPDPNWMELSLEGEKLRLVGRLPEASRARDISARVADATQIKVIEDRVVYSKSVVGKQSLLDKVDQLAVVLQTYSDSFKVTLEQDKVSITLLSDASEEQRETLNRQLNTLDLGIPYDLKIISPLDSALASDEVPDTQAQAKLESHQKRDSNHNNLEILAVNFGFDSINLTTESQTALDNLLQRMSDQPGLKLSIYGHTDSSGHPAHNLDLSQRRAEAVKKYLVDAGIEANRIIARGYGDTKPVASNQTPEGRFRNRRIEIMEDRS